MAELAEKDSYIFEVNEQQSNDELQSLRE